MEKELDKFMQDKIKEAPHVKATDLLTLQSLQLMQQQIDILNVRVEILENLLKEIGGILNEEE